MLWGLLYAPLLTTGRTPVARDLGSTHVPWRVTWRDQVASGALPLWDPASSQGRPLLANPNAMAAYPGTVLFLLLPPETAAMAHVAIHHLVLLLGCFVLARRTGAEGAAAALGALAAGAGGVAFSLTTFLNSLAAFAWAPWALATAVGAPTTRRVGALSGGALVGLSFLAGEPVTAALVALAWLLVVACRRDAAVVRSVPVFLIAAMGVAAPVLVPMLATYGETVRGTLGSAPGALAADALAPRRWLELVLPNLLGGPLGDGDTGFWAAASFPWQRYYPLLFAGGLPLLALPAARRKGLGVWWLLAAGGLLAAVALASPPVAGLLARFPLVDSLRFGVKLLLLPTLATPVLVAAGWQRLRQSGNRRAAAVVTLACLAVAAAPEWVLHAVLRPLYPASAAALDATPPGSVRQAAALDAAAVGLPAVAALLTGWAPLPVLLAGALGSGIAARGVLHFADGGRWASPPALREAIATAHPRLAWLPSEAARSAPGEDPLARFWRYRDELAPFYGTRWGAHYLLTRGPDGLEPLRQEVVAAAVADLDPPTQLRVAAALGAEAAITRAPVAGFPARVIDGACLVDLPLHAPPVYVASRAIPALGPVATVAALASEAFRPGIDAVIEGSAAARELAGGRVRDGGGPPHRRRFDVDAEGATLLVVGQTFSRSWRARIDGAAVSVLVANGAQCGVWVPAGLHQVELRLDPRPYAVGLAGPIVVLLIAVARRRRAA